MRLVDSATSVPEGTNEKSSPEVLKGQLHDTPSLQAEGSAPSEASQADSVSTAYPITRPGALLTKSNYQDSVAPSLSISFSSTTPHLAYSADYCSPAAFESASYIFSDSPYISTKYPPHPFASTYKNTRRGRRSPQVPSSKQGQQYESLNGALSPRGKNVTSLASSNPASGQEDSGSSENSDSDEDVEILLDSSYSRSPSIQPSITHSRVPSGSLLDGPAPSSAAMTESKTVGLGIESSSSSSDGYKPPRKATVDFVGSLPSFTISQPPVSPSSREGIEKS